jgi:hypothetical protein
MWFTFRKVFLFTLILIVECTYRSDGVTRVEAQDGGDPKNEVSPRDIVYTEPAEGGTPQVVAGTDLRYK